MNLQQRPVLIGVGGCGKELAFRVVEQDWILRYYLGAVQRSLDVYIIDTATSEVVEDKERVKDVEEKIGKIRGEYPNPGNVTIRVVCLTDIAEVNKPVDLTRKSVRDAVKEHGVETWWLEDPEKGIKFEDIKNIDININTEFSGGAYRRRAIAKAVFYKVISEQDPFTSFNFADRFVSIVTGLGGGTGSGILFDLAKYIKKKDVPMTLFAVLPTTKEGEKEKLNACIALSELEYSRLNGFLPFDYVILLPLDPTGHGKGDPKTEIEVDEFDTVFPYIFTSFHNSINQNIKIEDKTWRYSFFILANGFIIEYVAKKLMDLKREFTNAVDKFDKMIEAKESLNNLLTDFEWDTEGEARKEDFDFIGQELEGIELWGSAIFDWLKYETINELRDKIKFINLEKGESFGSLLDYVAQVKALASEDITIQFRDEVDTQLHNILPRALSTVETTAHQLKLTSGLKVEERTKRLLKEIVKGRMATLVSELQKDIKDIKKKYDNLCEKLREEEKEKEELEKLPSHAEDFAERTCRDIDRKMGEFSNLLNKESCIADRREELWDKIGEMVRYAREESQEEKIKQELSEENWLEMLGIVDLKNKINSIGEECQMNLDRLKTLFDDVAMYYYYLRENIFLLKRDFWQKVLGRVLFRKDVKREIENTETRKEQKRREAMEEAKNWGITIEKPFEMRRQENFLFAQFKHEAQEIEDKIIKFLKSEGVNEGYLNKIRGVMRETKEELAMRKGVKDELKDSYLSHEGYNEEIARINEMINGTKGDIEIEEMKLKKLERIDDLNQVSAKVRNEISTHHTAFIQYIKRIEEMAKNLEETSRKGVCINDIRNINPAILSIVTEESKLEELDNFEAGKEELEGIYNAAFGLISDELLSPGRIGVREPEIKFNGESWNFSLAVLSVASTSSDITKKASSGDRRDDIANAITKGLPLESKNDVAVLAYNDATNWHTALTLFSASTFFDNLSPLVRGGGYWKVYSKDRDNILHHSLLLQEGKYILRKEVITPEKSAAIAKREQDKEDVHEELNEIYEIKKWGR